MSNSGYRIDQLPDLPAAALDEETYLPVRHNGATYRMSIAGIGAVTVPAYIADGVIDCTEFLQAALATGYNVRLPAGRWKFTAGLTIAQDGQRVFGDGPEATILEPAGNFNVFTFASGVDRPRVEEMTLNGANMTGGYLFDTSEASRVYVQYLQITSAYNIAHIYKNNLCVFLEINASVMRGPYAFHAVGDTSNQTDVLRIQNVQIGNGPGAQLFTGLYIDGFINTVQIYSFATTAPLRGIHVVNTSGDIADRCNFIESFDYECDFPEHESIRIEAIAGANFTTTYANGAGSDADGIYIGEDCVDVNFVNPFSRGATKHGIYVAGKDCTFVGGEVVFNNSVAPFGVYDGVYVAGTAERISFSGVQSGKKDGVGSTQRYGLYVASGAQEITWNGGCLVGNLVDAYRDDSGISTPANVQVIGVSGIDESLMSNLVVGTLAGRRAQLTANVTAGAITSYTVVDGGEGYTAAPTGSVYHPTGTGATITVTVANGVVTGATGGGGSGYTGVAPVVYLRPVSTAPTFRPRWTGTADANAIVSAAGGGSAIMRNDYGISFLAEAVSNAVNYAAVVASATGNAVAHFAAGADTNISFNMKAKGSGTLSFYNDEGTGFVASTVASTVNAIVARGSATGDPVDVFPNGTDTNVDLRLSGKGTGTVRFGAFTSNADAAVNGYVTIKDAAGNTRKLATIA